jgi:hypothetical protein
MEAECERARERESERARERESARARERERSKRASESRASESRASERRYIERERKREDIGGGEKRAQNPVASEKHRRRDKKTRLLYTAILAILPSIQTQRQKKKKCTSFT